MWRAKLCGTIGNEPRQTLDLVDEDETLFLSLGRGDIVWVVGGLQALVELGMMADRHQAEMLSRM